MTRGRLAVSIALLAAIGVAVALWMMGADFYTTHPWDRAQHPDYGSLRSAGAWGHGLGIVGTALILANLTFLLRRRLRAFRRFGALRQWMNMHVLTGLLGPLLVVYHTAFEPRTAIAITALVSLGVLVLTGIVGRFIYAMVPHTVAGAEMGRAELERRLAEARDHLTAAADEGDPLWRALERATRAPRALPKSSVGSLLLLPYALFGNLALRLRLWRLGRGRGDVAWTDLRDYALIQRRLQTVSLYRRLLKWWRGLHRWVAALMVIAMVVHVVVALYFGYVPGEAGP